MSRFGLFGRYIPVCLSKWVGIPLSFGLDAFRRIYTESVWHSQSIQRDPRTTYNWLNLLNCLGSRIPDRDQRTMDRFLTLLESSTFKPPYKPHIRVIGYLNDSHRYRHHGYTVAHGYLNTYPLDHSLYRSHSSHAQVGWPSFPFNSKISTKVVTLFCLYWTPYNIMFSTLSMSYVTSGLRSYQNVTRRVNCLLVIYYHPTTSINLTYNTTYFR